MGGLFLGRGEVGFFLLAAMERSAEALLFFGGQLSARAEMCWLLFAGRDCPIGVCSGGGPMGRGREELGKESRTLMTREFDILVYGAGGYTAKYVIKSLARANVRLGLCGRSAKTIRDNVRGICGAETPIIECPACDAAEVTGRAAVVLNCAGPYVFCGEEVVRACVETGTHYLDISGETFFIERVLRRYDSEARRRGVCIVNCCGFDSIPADLGVEYLKGAFRGDVEITSVMRVSGAYLNRTTYDSLIYGLERAGATRSLRGGVEKSKAGRTRPKKYFYNERTRSYNVVFMGTDPSVVRRTQGLMKEKGLSGARYLAYFDVGGYVGLLLFKFYFLVIMVLSRFSAGRRLLLMFPSLFTHGRVRAGGPAEDMLERSSFEILFFGRDGGGREKKLVVRGPDPGYYTTSICLSEAGLCLLEMVQRGEGPPAGGGVLTPGSVFHGSDLVERLVRRGIEFEIVSD